MDFHRVLLLGQLHVHLAHQLVGGQEDLPVEVVEAVVKELGGLDEAVGQGDLGGYHPVRAQHHGEQAAVVPVSGGDQTVARRTGGAGLDAVSALIDVVVGRVAGDEVVGGVEFPGLGHVGGGNLMIDGIHQRHEVGVGAGLLGDEVEVPGGCVVADVGQTVGVAEIGILAPQIPGLLIHAGHESGDGPVNGLRQHVAPLVGGGEHDAVEQLLHGQLLAHLDAHVAAVRGNLGDGGLAGGEDLAFGESAVVNSLQHQQAGHDFGDAGGVETVVDVLLIENLLGLRVDEQGGLGRHVESGRFFRLRGLGFLGLDRRFALLLGRLLGCVGGQGGSGEGEEQEHGKKKSAETANFHIILSKNMVYW